jgi:hypothetical protein
MQDKDLELLHSKIDVLTEKVSRLEREQQLLLEKFSRHIDFINDTYEGLRNPIRVASKFFSRK